jgi:nucleotidyltransferase substrate binding protein (TIGR01987 family)
MASEKVEQKDLELTKAIESFDKSLHVNTKGLDEITVDVIYNGQIQKFEYTLELLWKTLKAHVKETGIDLNSPKSVFKHAFTFSDLEDEEKEIALDMIDDRNKIAHEYKDYIMDIIHPKLKTYLELIKKIAMIKIY